MTNQITNVNPNEKNIVSLLSGEGFKKQLLNVLPKTLTPDRLVRIAMTEIRMNPSLANCDPMAFAGAIMRCAQLGLEPSSERQHVHLLPFRNNRMNRTECQVIVGYRGFLSLASKSNVYIESDVVYENDEFEFNKGLETKLSFCPALTGERGEIIGAYAMARICLPNGNTIHVPEFMPKSEIDKVMASSKSASSSSSPWRSHYDAMARKTVIRRLFKYTPINEEMDAAITVDEMADRDAQDNAKLVSEVEFVNTVDDQPTEETPETEKEPTSKADSLAAKLGG